ncbi:MAG: putative manganese-dependent inorganic diphosphatase [Ruminococcaceae bacterium]|nr:putative manganese-dependent inorganic diphosphatase [Oscillospiraceae bacterium]
MDTIYITGHRNPDTDSIVSAMAYAALKNALGDRCYQAARLGHISDETQAVLDRFKVKPPIMLHNLRTQVQDLDYDTPPILSPAATISRAWQMMSDDHIKVLPIANDDGTLYGMVSSGDMTTNDVAAIRDSYISGVPVYNLLSVLEGRILNKSGETKDNISGEVTIALPTGRENLIFSAQDSIVVCGDQPDMIRRAIELNVNCVIVCQAEVQPELLELPCDTCLISTPLDAYRVVHLICNAMPVGSICQKDDIVSFHLEDYIDDVRNTVLQSRFRAYPILDEHERVVGTLSRFHLLRPRRKRVILVDHNEQAQSVAGLDQAEILEIVDHHRLADIETTNPIYVRNEPVGSTATIVAGMYQEKGLMPTETMAGLMAAAIVSDTVMFKSPTCTQRDIDVANRMARIANVSLEELGQAIFSAASGDDKTVQAMLETDYKEFHIAGHNLAISQITCMDSERVLKRKDEFLAAMEQIRQKKRLDTVLLMITDVLLDGTHMLFLGDENNICQAFNLRNSDGNSAFLPKILSRKKQVVPTLTALWG